MNVNSYWTRLMDFFRDPPEAKRRERDDYSGWIDARHFEPENGMWVRVCEEHREGDYIHCGRWRANEHCNLEVFRSAWQFCEPLYWKPLDDEEIAAFKREHNWDYKYVPPKILTLAEAQDRSSATGSEA